MGERQYNRSDQHRHGYKVNKLEHYNETYISAFEI
jgi:hypothetical protein